MNNLITINLPFVDNLGDKSITNLIDLICNNIIGIETINNYKDTDLEIEINFPLSDEFTTNTYKQKIKNMVRHIITKRTKEWLDKDEFDQGKHPENYCTILKCLCNFEGDNPYDYK